MEWISLKSVGYFFLSFFYLNSPTEDSYRGSSKYSVTAACRDLNELKTLSRCWQ